MVACNGGLCAYVVVSNDALIWLHTMVVDALMWLCAMVAYVLMVAYDTMFC